MLKTSIIAGPLAKAAIAEMMKDGITGRATRGLLRVSARRCTIKGKPSGGIVLTVRRAPYQHESGIAHWRIKRLKTGWTPESAKRHLADLIESAQERIMSKQLILEALQRFINQRPGMDFANYGDVSACRSEARQIARDRHEASALLDAVRWRDSITAEKLVHASERAYSGRLTIKPVYVQNSNYYGLNPTLADAVSFSIDYCTGQYFPTEYRKAVCAVLASALWEYARENMPAPTGKLIKKHGVGTFAHESEHDNIDGLSPGDWLRKHFKQEFGRTIANRWFN